MPQQAQTILLAAPFLFSGVGGGRHIRFARARDILLAGFYLVGMVELWNMWYLAHACRKMAWK